MSDQNNAEIRNNFVQLWGKLLEDFKFDHEYMGEEFYISILRTYQNGHREDITIMLNRTQSSSVPRKGDHVMVHGDLRKVHKRIFVHINELIIASKQKKNPANMVELFGTVCRSPIFRKTKYGKECAKWEVAVKGRNTVYYIPCVVWGKNANKAQEVKKDEQLFIEGYICFGGIYSPYVYVKHVYVKVEE